MRVRISFIYFVHSLACFPCFLWVFSVPCVCLCRLSVYSATCPLFCSGIDYSGLHFINPHVYQTLMMRLNQVSEPVWPDLTLTSLTWPHLTSPNPARPEMTWPNLLTWPDLTWHIVMVAPGAMGHFSSDRRSARRVFLIKSEVLNNTSGHITFLRNSVLWPCTHLRSSFFCWTTASLVLYLITACVHTWLSPGVIRAMWDVSCNRLTFSQIVKRRLA